MTPPLSAADAVTELGSSFSGQILRRADADYDRERRVHNGLVDKHPALIARCRGISDIVAALHFARREGLEIAVRGGSHNVAGRATIDDGLMIDLSLMKGIEVDPENRTVRAQGGVTWGELNQETQLHGLATTGGIVSSTGIAGLTLGGGLGYLMGKYGLAADNLLSAEMVTAEGQVLTASRDENPDLFWGIRGGGGNFGIAASFEYRLHQIGPMITAGLVAHSSDHARDVLRFYHDFTTSITDELTVYVGLLNAPDGSGAKLAAMPLCHCGPLGEGETAVRPIKKFGSPAVDVVGPMPYCRLNAMLDEDYPRGALNYWKSSFLSELSGEAIDTLADCSAKCPSSMRGSGIVLEHVHGAATRHRIEDTAFPHRRNGYSMVILAQWMDPADTDRCIEWARQSFAAMEPYMAPGAYVNYLDRDEAADRVISAYGQNYGRLQQLKAKYDPQNVFHMNQNIRPGR